MLRVYVLGFGFSAVPLFAGAAQELIDSGLTPLQAVAKALAKVAVCDPASPHPHLPHTFCSYCCSIGMCFSFLYFTSENPFRMGFCSPQLFMIVNFPTSSSFLLLSP